ncbi:MAG TPA: hypothetical protein VK753_08380, partial [Xanthomonadaceae bacterium]|nr:hypothetical protein [Xanthomonadaceae bacterium]
AATELGMYASFDDGAHWQPLQMNLPRTSVRDIDVHDDDVVIATHGRGFWVLDDVASLRQLGDDGSLGETKLFVPSTAIRVRPSGFTGTPLPKEEPVAANPPFGARLDYVLATTPKQPLRLTIRDGQGQVVRSYSSADAPPAHDLATIDAMPEWYPPPSMLRTTPGWHRFVWPLRYPAPPASAQGNAYSEGVWAPPGHYSVELDVDGKTWRQPLDVVPDPRVHLPAEAYAQQFTLAREVEAAQARLAQAQSEEKAWHKALGNERKGADLSLRVAIDAFDDKLVAIDGLTQTANPNNAWAFPPKSTSTLVFVADGLDKLLAAVDDADAAPTTDARTGYARMLPMLDGVLAAWERLKTTDLAALNARLKEAGKPMLDEKTIDAEKAQ